MATNFNLTPEELASPNINRIITNKLRSLNPEVRANMTAAAQKRKGKKLSPKTIELLRQKSTGKKHTEETKKKMSLLSKGRKHSEETKRKLSEDRKGKKHWAYGKKLSSKQKEKLRQAKLGKKRPKSFVEKMKSLPKVTCPHCGKIGQEKVMKRWHFDNCKNKK